MLYITMCCMPRIILYYIMNILYYVVFKLYNMQRTESGLLDEQPVVLIVGRDYIMNYYIIL